MYPQSDKPKQWATKGPILIVVVLVGLAGFLFYQFFGQEKKQEIRQEVQITADSTRQADSLLQTEPDDTVMTNK